MNKSVVKFESFPVHQENNFQVYKYWTWAKKKDEKEKEVVTKVLIKQPLVYRGCTPNCYFDLDDLSNRNNLEYCPVCFNSQKGQQLIFDMGFKRILSMYAKRLQTQFPLFIKINPLTKKVFIPNIKRTVESELAFLMYKQRYQPFILNAKLSNGNHFNLGKITKQLKQCFAKITGFSDQTKLHNLFSFCRRPRIDRESQMLLFFLEKPHQPVPFTIIWKNEQGIPMENDQTDPLNDNFNHNAVISLVQINKVKNFVIAITTTIAFKIFVASLDPNHLCIKDSNRTLGFILVKDYSCRKQYPCQFTDHNRSIIYLFGGFVEDTKTDRKDLKIESIKWDRKQDKVLPIVTIIQGNNIFPQLMDNRQVRRDIKRECHAHPVYRGFSLTGFSDFADARLKRKAIERRKQTDTIVWFAVGGQKLRQDVTRNLQKTELFIQRQPPGYQQIFLYNEQDKKRKLNPVQTYGGINYAIDNSSLYPLISEFPLTGKKKDDKLSSRYFIVRNSNQLRRKKSELDFFLVIVKNGQVQPVSLLQSPISNPEIVNNIQTNGDNFISLLFDAQSKEGEYYLRANFSLKRPIPSQRQRGKEIQYISLEYFYYRNQNQVFFREGYVRQ